MGAGGRTWNRVLFLLSQSVTILETHADPAPLWLACPGAHAGFWSGGAEAVFCGSYSRPCSSQQLPAQTETVCLKPVPAVPDRHCFGTFGYSRGAESRDLALGRGWHEDFLILTDFPACLLVLWGAPQLSWLPWRPPHLSSYGQACLVGTCRW